MTEFINRNGAVYITLAFCALGVAVNGILWCTYVKLIRAAKDMGHSEHRLMKALCKRFETCYQLKIGVPDVPVFVDKYVRHHRVLGLHLLAWESVSNLCMLLAMMTALGGAVWAMAGNLDPHIFYGSLLAGVFGNGILLAFDCFYNIRGKRELLRTDIIDFLGNIYKPRLENETFHVKMLEEYRQQYFEEDPEQKDKVVNFPPREKEKEKPPTIEFTREEEELIRDVIREYMG